MDRGPLASLRGLVAPWFDEVTPFLVFGPFAGIEGAHRTVIAHDPGPDLAPGAFFVPQWEGDSGGRG